MDFLPKSAFLPRTLSIASLCRDSCLYCEDDQENARHCSVMSHQVACGIGDESVSRARAQLYSCSRPTAHVAIREGAPGFCGVAPHL